MFNLLIKGGGWGERADWLPDERVFEYTAQPLADRFRRRGELPRDEVRELPTLFMPESGAAEQGARIGRIVGFRLGQKRIGLDYVLERRRIPFDEIERLAPELDIDRFEFNRTHWAVKDVDLPSVLASIDLTSDTSTLVRATSPERWRERALNLVEELAANCAASQDPEEQAAGHLALGAVQALRPYIARELDPNRRGAWAAVFRALVDFIPYGKQSMQLADAVRGLAQAHGISLP